MRKRTEGGHYYERDWTGRLRDTAQCGIPDVVICRRVVDYAPAPVPPTAAVTESARCGAVIAYNPANPHTARPKICMQCGGIEPLPIES
jgi:hypothetical protein